ncbi:hypothetical protein [Microbacterium sp. P04]|uniref:hypothetical protein n=1 Tax=Microbacterium sp. P04 TaxID=3366947 RepID=UPI00374589C9
MATTNPYLYGAVKHRVTAPAIVARSSNGSEAYVYRGSLVPVTTLPSQVEHLLAMGLIEPVEVAS